MKRTSAKSVKRSRPGTRKRQGLSLSGELFPVAAIGASAGGLEAACEFLAALPPDLGFAYVFIHHLAPDHPSNLSEIFQRKTSMPVTQVEEGMAAERNHIYVIPPNTFMNLDETGFRLKSRSRLDVPYHPIDYFFVSLADLRQHNSIGILLSGTATDGTLGMKAIKEAGGITFAQDATAKHEQMPRNAADAGYANFVLSPEAIAQELSTLVPTLYSTVSSGTEVVKDEEGIKEALDIVLRRKGVDFFSHYKRNTVYRRMLRRMALLKISSTSEYIKKLTGDEGEVEALFHDFLINVTSFFREPAYYKAIEKTVFPALLKTLKPADPIRIWIAGCATGEEAYSTAICLTEFLQQKKASNPVHIFATDLNDKAISVARLGIYPASLVQHISTQRLKKFFVRMDDHYQIIKSVREMCIFSQHDLLKDPPFSRIDLISCQNVLIYMESAPQRRILHSFHYALKPSGFLMLGKSESITNNADLFQPSEKDGKLLIKKNAVQPPFDLGHYGHPVSQPSLTAAPSVRTENDVERESDKLLLNRYVPPSVLVNKDLDIIRFRGPTSAFIQPAPGKASLSLLKMVKDDLLFDLRSALQQARKTGLVAIKENFLLDREESGHRVNIEVVPIKSGKDLYYLVIFKEFFQEPVAARKGKPVKSGDAKAKIRKLEQALDNARDQIRSTSEEFETGREELQSANEEILSSNEELQSINEELETSKEELQSSNEELTTINEELQTRNVELKYARDYAEAIIETIRGPLMVLTSDMRVRTANKAFCEFFRLSKGDTEGSFIYELADRQWDIPALRDHINEILPRDVGFKDFTINHDFPGIGNRTMIVNAHKLIHSAPEEQPLILLSFEDITRYKMAEQSLLETQEQLQLALSGAFVGTWAWNIKTNEVTASSEEHKLYGLPLDSSLKTYAEWETCVHPLDLATTRKALQDSIENKIPLDIEFRILWPDGSTHWILAKANTYYDEVGKPEKMVGVNIDFTERKTAMEALAESEKRFHTMSDNAPVMIWMAGADKKMNFLNKTWLTFTGKTLEEESGEGWFAGIHPGDKDTFVEIYNHAFDAHQEFKTDYRLKRHDGKYRWIMNHGVPRFTGERFIGFIGTCIDITDRIDLERQKDDFMGIASHELKTPVTSIKAYTQILQEKFRKANDTVSTAMLTRLDLQIDKLTGLINTLLDVAKVQSGQMDYAAELLEVKDLILDVVDQMQGACPKHKIITQVETSGKVMGDKKRLEQVLTNLISNAVKYSPEAREVIVKVVRDNHHYVFSVQDFGVGIPKDMQDKVFGRFFRVSESSGNRVSGLGLGLFIALQIVKQHNGKLWLESQPGKGSTFYFSLAAERTQDQ